MFGRQIKDLGLDLLQDAVAGLDRFSATIVIHSLAIFMRHAIGQKTSVLRIVYRAGLTSDAASRLLAALWVESQRSRSCVPC